MPDMPQPVAVEDAETVEVVLGGHLVKWLDAQLRARGLYLAEGPRSETAEPDALRWLFVGVSDRVLKESSCAVLIVGRTSSRCSACGGNAIPGHGDDTAHVMVSGYAQKPGCGAVWTHVTTDCLGGGAEDAARRLAPGLPWIDYGDIYARKEANR